MPRRRKIFVEKFGEKYIFSIFLGRTIPRLIHRIRLMFKFNYIMVSGYKLQSQPQYNPHHPSHLLLEYLAEIVGLGGDCRQIVANMLLSPETVDYVKKLAYIESNESDKLMHRELDEIFDQVCENYRKVYRINCPIMMSEFNTFFDELFI